MYGFVMEKDDKLYFHFLRIKSWVLKEQSHEILILSHCLTCELRYFILAE